MKTQYVWSVWRKLVSLLAILPLFLFAASPAHAIVFDYEANVSGLGSQQVRQTVSGEALIAQSSLDQMNDWSTYTGSGALSGSKSIVTSTQFGQEWSVDFSLAGGKAFDLTSITFGEAFGTNETVTLASNRGAFATCTVAGNSGLGMGTPATVCTLYGADATAMQGITSFRVTASPSNFALGFDDVTLTNIAAVPSAPTITGITPSVGQLSVAFTAGADNGTPLTNYEYSTNGGGSFTAVSPASTASPIVITGLTNGTAYQVQIRAVNAIRKGVATASTTGTPLFPPPTATTGSASSISTTGATLNGTVNDNGVTTTMGFDYGATAGYGSSASAGTLGAGTGTTPTAVSVSGLSCNTTYHFRVNGASSAGTTNGSDASFTTSACPLLYTVTYNGNGNTGGSAPTDATVYASNATVTVASNSGGLTRTGYTFSGWNTASDGSGTQYAAGSGSFNINASTVLYAKWVANAPSATTGSASGIGANGATLNGTANDNGLSTTVSFDYGATASYGTNVAGTPGTVGAGAGATAVSAVIGSLACNTTYHYRAVAVSIGGTTFGSDATFTTAACVPGTPAIGSATAGDAQATVTFTPGSTGGATVTYTATCTSSDGGATGANTGAASPILVTGLTNGKTYTCSVLGTNSAGSGPASGASNSIVPKAAQTITFANPGAQNFGTTPTLSATSTSGLTVVFSSTATPGVCTITSGGALTFLTTGTCTISADQAGNAAYVAATQVSQSFAVNAVVPGAPSIGTATAGDTQASVAFTPGFTGGATVTYTATCTSSNGGATGGNTGAASPITVTGLTNGKTYTCAVTGGNSAGTGTASAASNAVTPKGAQSITFAPPGAQNFGTTPTLTAMASSGLAVSFSSTTTTSVCTVTSGGVLSFLTTGTCTINADQAGDGTYLVASQVSQSFTVHAVVPGAPTIGTASTDNARSSVSFTAPAFNGGATIDQYAATCTSSNGGTTGTNTGTSSPIVVTGLTNGKTYTCSVTAHNSAGTGAASAASNTVTPAPGPAVLSVAVPANGSYRAGQNLDFTITWDQATAVTGTPGITLVIGATTVQAAFVSSPSTTTSLFRYTVLAGQTDTDGVAVGTLSLNGGTIRNAVNSDAALTLNSVGSTAGVLVDTTAPTLPAANIVVNNQADPHKLVLTFSEALASGSLGSAAGWTVTANGGSPFYTISSVALAGGNQVTLTLNAVDMGNTATAITNVAANAHLKVTPPATLTDVAGNTYAAGQVTEAGATHVLDSTAPTLSGVATSGPTTSGGTLAATASEKALGYWIAVATGSAAPTAVQTQAGANYAAVMVVAHGSGALPNATAGSLTLAGLSASTTYDIHVVAQDAAGNLSAATSTATLTTAAAPNPFTPLPTPAPIPGISGWPGVVNMASGSAPAISSCLMDTLRQILGGDPVYLGQSATGEMRVGWNGQIISFYPLAASATDARITGLHNQSINPLDVVTSCGTLNVTPALFNPAGLGAIMASMGLTAQINAQGVITVLYNGSYYVVRPDFIVSTGNPGGPSLGFGADGLLRFTDSNGNTQIMRPAFLDPAALQTQVSQMGGSMVVQLDATVLVALGNGQQFVLTPDLTLVEVPSQFASLFWWQDGPVHYRHRVMTAPFMPYSQGMSVSVKP